MVVSKYEENRLKRLEQNKKKLEELNLNLLSQALQNSIGPKPSHMKKVKPKVARQPADPSSIRKSSRFAGKPQPNYKEVPVDPLGKTQRYSYRRRDFYQVAGRVYASDEGREYAIHAADELKTSLDRTDPNVPSFVKPMLQSHVTGGFWLGLPLKFCKSHLPKRDEIVTLVDEQEEEFETRYLVQKAGLSGGWRGFSMDHELVDGDALVFQLMEPTRFKVYIIRVNEAENNN